MFTPKLCRALTGILVLISLSNEVLAQTTETITMKKPMNSGFRSWTVVKGALNDFTGSSDKILADFDTEQEAKKYSGQLSEQNRKWWKWTYLVCKRPENAVRTAAFAFPEGGGYDKQRGNRHGTPEDVIFKGKTILEKEKSKKGTYCSGFTFAVAMKVAKDRGLLESKSLKQIERFQREWFGVPDSTVEKQAVAAMENLGIGKEISADNVQSGDFVQFWRTSGNSNGHSVVFLDWVIENDKKVGIRYRSSQGKTNGIGNQAEFFKDVEGKNGSIIRPRTYFGRLNR